MSTSTPREMFNFVQLYIALFYVLIFTSPYNVYIDTDTNGHKR